MEKPAPTASPLRHIWRRFAATTALGTTLLVAAGGQVQAQVTVDKPQDDIYRMFAPKKGPMTPAQQRDDNMNTALMQDAASRFLKLAPLAETPYAVELHNLQARLDGYMKKFGGAEHNKRAVILNPYHFDAGLALGLKGDKVVRLMLQAAGVEGAEDKFVKDIAKKLGRNTITRFMYMTQTEEASTHPESKTRVVVIVPTSDHALLFEIKGLPLARQVELINRHESWHARNTKYTQTEAAQDLVNAARNGDPVDFVKNRRALAAFSSLIRSETLSDVGAIGDMIREGHGLELLDAMRSKRKSVTEDTEHMSVMALDGLRSHITKMGLENFRKLDDGAATALYYAITDKFSPSARSLQIAYAWQVAETEAQRQQLKDIAKTDVEAAKGIAFLRFMPDPEDHSPPPAPKPLSPAEEAANEALTKWDHLAALEQRAFELGGKATPETYIRAYASLQSDIWARIQREPDNLMLPEQMTKLQTNFAHGLGDVNFAAINRQHGIRIENVEPSLKKFRATSSPALKVK